MSRPTLYSFFYLLKLILKSFKVVTKTNSTKYVLTFTLRHTIVPDTGGSGRTVQVSVTLSWRFTAVLVRVTYSTQGAQTLVRAS